MPPFHFKQFSAEHDRCAMKIGTDAVLLGAWAGLENQPTSILDIGAGSGIISLQLAQRCSAQTIDAVEIDDNAYEQCVDNFENSPWGDRLFCYHASFDEFVKEMDPTYELIVSNPPFHDLPLRSEQVSSGNNFIAEARKAARFSSFLPFPELLRGVSILLAKNGIFAVIVPKENEADFVHLAFSENLHLQKRTEVKGTPKSPIKRSLLQFGFQQTELTSDILVIEKSRHVYTEEYKNLTQDFYLNM